MIYILTSLYYLLTDKRKYSISKVLFFVLLFSSISAYLVGRQPSLSIDVTIYVLFNTVLLFILFYSFKNYSNITVFNDTDVIESRLNNIERITIIIGILTFAVNAYIFYKVYSLLLVQSFSVQEYKNEGGAADIFTQYVPSFVISLSNLFSPIGYFSLTLHFYYLIKRRIGKSILHLILSFLIILSGLLALSRSSIILYVLVYFIMFFFIYPLVKKNTRKKIILIISGFIFLITSIFITISETRFSERYTKNSLNEAIIDHEKQPMLYSIFDYFSQWVENGPIIMENHEPQDNFWGLYNSSGLAVQIQKIIYGSHKVNADRNARIFKMLGYQASNFHGNIARLVYDFGFFGTFLFILLYAFIIKKNRPRNGILKFKTLLFLPVILPFCVLFFTGNALSSLQLNIAIIFSIIIFLYIKD